jgi:hypothetical protein
VSRPADLPLDTPWFTILGDPRRAWLILQLARVAGFRFHLSNSGDLDVDPPRAGALPVKLRNLLKFWIIAYGATIAELLEAEGGT